MNNPLYKIADWYRNNTGINVMTTLVNNVPIPYWRVVFELNNGEVISFFYIPMEGKLEYASWINQVSLRDRLNSPEEAIDILKKVVR